MATKKQQNAIEPNPEKTIEEALSKSGKFIEDNSKTILTVFICICAIVCGFFAYLYMYKAPRENQAAADMYKAIEMYARDSFEIALNGNSEIMGLLEVAETYSGTPQANIANHIIGICYLNTGKYEDAIKYFTSFSRVDGTMGNIVSAQNKGLTGDAYMQLGDADKALQYYEAAAKESDDAYSTPMYLFKAAAVNYDKGNYSKATEQYTTIRDVYPSSTYARNIEKYISMAKSAE